jgi:hypothetical protein
MALNISAWSIRNPLPSIVFSIILLVLGWVSFTKLAVTRLPSADIPVISVAVSQFGAAPSELESQVTKTIEDGVSGVEGVRQGNVVAFSRPGRESEELVVVLETRETSHDAIKAAVAKAVRAEIGVPPADVVCLEPGTLPKTSSGKLQRRKTRSQDLSGELGREGARTMGASGDAITVARHMAKSLWSRAKATLIG